MSSELLFYEHSKIEDVRMSRPGLWVTKYLYTIKTTPKDLKYFVADECKVVVPDIKESIYASCYKAYSADQVGVVEFWTNFHNLFSWNNLNPRKVTVDVQNMKKCRGMNKDYELMDNAMIYLHYDNDCTMKTTGENLSFEVCDKLVINNNKIVEFHHSADLKAIYPPVPPPVIPNTHNVVQLFEDAFAIGDIDAMLALLSPEFKFRIYKADQLSLLANITEPGETDRNGFSEWLNQFFNFVKIKSHKAKQQVNDKDNKSYVTVEGVVFPAWKDGSRKPWSYYDIHNFDLTGAYNDQETLINGFIWHLDYHPLVPNPNITNSIL